MPPLPPVHQNGAKPPSSTSLAAERSRSQWIFTQSDLQRTPSIAEGLSAEQELANRQKGVNFITQVGMMLKLPQLTLSTASIFFHRYYMRFPMQVPGGKGSHHYQIAATALFLATKVEEFCRKMKELIVACCRVAQKNSNAVVDEQSKEYWKWRDTILHHEDMLLEALCFDLQLEQPYKILYDSLCYYGVHEHKILRNISWAFLNDSHITTMCLLFSPKTIAGSALYAGVKLAGVTLSDDDQGKPWWESLELNIFDIQKACNQMAEVYENQLLPRKGGKDAYMKDDDIMSFERTRRTQSPSVEHSPAYSSASQGIKREREESWGHEGKNGYSMERGLSQQTNADQAMHSPKRQRVDSSLTEPNPDGLRGPRIPPSASSRIPPTASNKSQDAEPEHDRHDSALAGESLSRRTPAGNGPADGAQDYTSNSRNRQRETSTSSGNIGLARGVEISSSHPPTHVKNGVDNFEEVDYGSEEGEV